MDIDDICLQPEAEYKHKEFMFYDGPVIIGIEEWENILDEGNILRMLFEGRKDMLQESNEEIFKYYKIKSSVFNVIRKCIIDGVCPSDDMAINILKSGELRDTCNTLGGFKIIDDIINKYYQKDKKIKEDNSYYTNCILPILDIKNIFQWRSIPYGQITQYELSLMLKDIFINNYYVVHTDDNFYHFRR